LLLLGSLPPVAGPARGAAGPARYRVIDLGSKDPSVGIFPRGINDAGQVVGWFGDPRTRNIHGFRTAPGKPFDLATDDLGDLGTSGHTYGYAINNLGQAVGYSGPLDGLSDRGFRTQANHRIQPGADDLRTFFVDPSTGEAVGTSRADGINNAGQVVGTSF